MAEGFGSAGANTALDALVPGKGYAENASSIASTGKIASCFADSGSAARFFYCAKASKSERNRGCEGLPEVEATKFDGGDFERGNGNNAKEQKLHNFHPTVKPIALMEYLVKLVSPENSIVLDPFAGSGSTLIACKNLGREYIGIEMNPEYIEIINARLSYEPKSDNKQTTLL